MQFHLPHKLIATRDGIFLDDKPLHKCALNTFSRRSLLHLLRATELHAKMTPRDWEPPAPHDINHVPLRAEFEMNLALANPGSFPGLLNKEFDPNQPRDGNGRWTYEGTAHVDAAENGGQRATHLAWLDDSSPFDSSNGSGGFSPVPTPTDVFVPGTPANNAFVNSIHQITNAAAQMSGSDASPEDKKEKNCRALRDSILDTCASLAGRKKTACFAAADKSYEQCMSEQ